MKGLYIKQYAINSDDYITSPAKYFVTVKRASLSNKLHKEIQSWVLPNYDRKIASNFQDIYQAIEEKVFALSRENPKCKPVSVSTAEERSYTGQETGEGFYFPYHIWLSDRNFELCITLTAISGTV